MSFRDLPIRRKLSLAVFLTSLVGLALAYVVLFGYEIYTYRQNTSRNFSMVAEIIATNSSAALIYDDPKVAREILSGLRARQGIAAAALFDKDGKFFAGYPADLPRSTLPSSLPPDGITFHSNDLTLYRGVLQGDRRVGTLFLQVDLQSMYRRLWAYGLVLLCVLAGSGLVALLLSHFFQRRISEPLLGLARTAKLVSENKDYSVRAIKTSDDELGVLTAAFNSMLGQVQTSHTALRASEEQLSAVFQQAGAGIAQADLTGRFVMVNDRFCEIVGRPREALLALRINDITHPDDQPENDALLQEIRAGRPNASIDKRYIRADGSPVWVRNSLVALRNSEGQIEFTLAVVQDVTASKTSEQALRASEAQFRFVTDHAPVLLAHMDRDYHYRFVNRPYAQRYGREPDDVIGRHAVEIVGQALFDIAYPHFKQALSGQTVEFELHIPHAGPGPRWTHATYTPERNAAGDVIGVVAVHADITQRKHAEQEMERARDQAQAASRAKDDFLAALSHELRTPLSPVLLLASEGANNPALSAEVRADFATIQKNADLEARLIDDLLDLTRITRGKLALELAPVDLSAILRDALAIVHLELEQKKISLELDFTPDRRPAVGDAVRLQQVFWNVLKNAVKFTPEGGEIAVKTRLDVERRRTVLTVSDTGIGLTPAELERIFQAFSQGDHARGDGPHRFGGLGLGLAISRMLIELHSGTIRAVSDGPGTGATFVIELPLAPIPAESSAPFVPVRRPVSNPPLPIVPPAPTDPRRRILLVDDHSPTRTTLAHLLGRRHYDVVCASSVSEALQYAADTTFDILVSDIGLPDGDGYALLADLRARQPGLKGIALSGYGMEEDIARALQAGFAEHLTKPISIGKLERALARTLQVS